MERILGEPSRTVICTKFSSLTDELCKIPNGNTVSVVIVSCLSSILERIVAASEVKSGIERAMLMVGNLFHDIHRVQHGKVKILVGPILPRNLMDWTTHSRYALVISQEVIIN